MKSQVFEYESYRRFLEDFLEAQPQGGRGWGSKIASHLGCHTSFVSHVLSGKVDFSLEQALRLSQLLKLTPDESDFFLFLISRERAGSADLKHHFTLKIQEVREKRREVVHRIGKASQLKAEEQMRYYSSWVYAVVHVLTSIPGYRTVDAISGELGLSAARVGEVLEDLARMGLVKAKGREWHRTERALHLAAKSPMIKKHHQNWRLKALDAIDEPAPTDLHYSSVVGISQADAEKIQEALMSAISNVRTIVRESPEEAVYCYTLDFFAIGK